MLIYLDQGSDSDAQKTIKYDFDLLERNCLVQKLFQNSDVSFVRVDIFNLDKYVSWADNNTGNARWYGVTESPHDQPQQKWDLSHHPSLARLLLAAIQALDPQAHFTAF